MRALDNGSGHGDVALVMAERVERGGRFWDTDTLDMRLAAERQESNEPASGRMVFGAWARKSRLTR